MDESALIADGERIDYINENLRLIQKIGGLTFGTDAYLLAAFAKKTPAARGVDLGSGTGVAALLMLAGGKCKHMHAVELQEEFSELIERNALLNGLSSRLTILTKDAREITNADTAGEVDVIVSNPPYMPVGSGLPCTDNRMEIARRESNGGIFDFSMAAARLLKTGGHFYTVFRPDRLADLLVALRTANLEPKRLITVYPDAESRPCLILSEAKKGAAAGLIQAPPLIIYQSPSDRTYTKPMAKIYDTFSIEHLFQNRKGG